MYINNKVYIEDHNCEKCKNNNICKWVPSMDSIHNNVNKVKNNKELGSPINIKITCDNFEKSIKKEGYYWGNNPYNYGGR